LTNSIGAGESGKSTILKQMKLIHDGGFTSEEREAYKDIIVSNSIQSIHVILEAMETLDIPLGDPENNQKYHDFILDQRQQTDCFGNSTQVVEAIKALWADSGVQETFKRSNEYQLNDSAS
jgi:guanine nucleotide-binding protein subunit alpha